MLTLKYKLQRAFKENMIQVRWYVQFQGCRINASVRFIIRVVVNMCVRVRVVDLDLDPNVRRLNCAEPSEVGWRRQLRIRC
jgi:hypothetical protein